MTPRELPAHRLVTERRALGPPAESRVRLREVEGGEGACVLEPQRRALFAQRGERFGLARTRVRRARALEELERLLRFAPIGPDDSEVVERLDVGDGLLGHIFEGHDRGLQLRHGCARLLRLHEVAPELAVRDRANRPRTQHRGRRRLGRRGRIGGRLLGELRE